ncbi:methionine--tRNA ligase subunit beta [Ignisphaera sp. 4213-co]|uniref:Methionine--tRNA ligase n=1 Tax=Ignisphaera cupida TaxID=3050454 RepID=A0ABD4Z957_9CREN|nr:methionine--tRNA ligase subunit beta [Ignisphaera sp. 4213-co]MDK6029103.1 methionine--tRNA ligase subunit beta [Ignisphaera sp. 4213-co]
MDNDTSQSQEIIDIEYFKKIDLRIGIVKYAEKIPGSKKLLRLLVDIGSEVRQIVAGLAEWYRPEDLVGKQVVIVTNLKPKKIMNYESQGMLLATCNGEKPLLITVEGVAKPGSKIC